MAKKKTEAPSCLLCHQPATDIVSGDSSFLVECIECGAYEILELAARHIQDYPLEDRLRILEQAKRAAEGQDGPPLIREPFAL